MVEEGDVLEAHKKSRGKIGIIGRVEVETREQLSTYYTPGVAYACLAIKDDKNTVYDYTLKGRTVAIVTDGTRVLGLGKIGPDAGLPVMEGKALLLKKFGGVDAFPLCIGDVDEDRIVEIVKAACAPFGAINIEDIETPKCLRIADRLKKELDIPVFHDDRNGVGVVALAALTNALKLAGKKLSSAKIVINGAGTAGIGIAEMLSYAGARNIYAVDTSGLIYKGRQENMNYAKEMIADITNRDGKTGDIRSVANGADVLIGVSAKGAFDRELIGSMSDKAIVFALANPDPEISYEEAKGAGAFIVATGRSDTPNQVNNLSAFPGILRGILEARAKGIDEYVLLRASAVISKAAARNLSPESIMPDLTDNSAARKLTASVAAEVVRALLKQGLARIDANPSEVKKNVSDSLKKYRKLERLAARQGLLS
ncbi:MAG: NADP-dependent malic enzyme [Candidatus Micrarchaeota archaeon]|nr:NADP-dependent malic enzyme [Candidatus Micrarchaeota archaeon]